MDQSNESRERENARREMQVWCCDQCRAVHFKAGKVLLNFTKEEFAALAYEVNDVFQEQFGSLEFYNLINLISRNGDVLADDRIF